MKVGMEGSETNGRAVRFFSQSTVAAAAVSRVTRYLSNRNCPFRLNICAKSEVSVGPELATHCLNSCPLSVCRQGGIGVTGGVAAVGQNGVW